MQSLALANSIEFKEIEYAPTRFVTDISSLRIQNEIGLGKILGFPGKEFTGSSIMMLLTESSKQSLLFHISPLTAEFQPINVKLEFITNNKPITLTWTIRPLLENGWKVLAYEWTYCDISSSDAMDFRQLTDIVPVMIIRLNTDLQFTFINKICREVFRKTNEAVLGKTMQDLGLNPVSWQNFKSIAFKLIQDGIPTEFTFKIPSLSNSSYHYRLLVKLTPEFDASGKVYSIVGVANDIGPLLKAQENLEYKDQLLSLMADIANQLLIVEDSMEIFASLLTKIGDVVSADKIFLFENGKDDCGQDVIINRIAWNSKHQSSIDDGILSGNLPLQCESDYNWLEQHEGICYGYNVSQVKNPLYVAFLQRLKVNSFLVVPVFVEKKHWGFLIVSDRKEDRVWTDDEKYFFNTFASSFSASIARKKQVQKLRESEERFRQISDKTPVMIWVSDENDTNTYVNQSWKDFTGFTNGMDANYSWEKRVFAEDIYVVEEYRQKFNERKPLHQEYRLMSSNGEYKWVIDNSIPRTSPDGSFLGYIGIMLDINDKKVSQLEMQIQQERLNEYADRIGGILDSITDGFIAVDESLIVFLWNAVIERKTGLLARQAIGRPMKELFPKMEQEMLTLMKVSLLSKNTQSLETYINATKSWEEITVFPSAQGLFIYYKDITKRKRLESLLALEKDVLELNARPQFSLGGLCFHMLERLQGILSDYSFSVITFSEDGQKANLLAAVGLSAYYRAHVESWLNGEPGGVWSLPFEEGTVNVLNDFNVNAISHQYRKLMEQHRFTSVFASPVYDSHEKLVAVFCIYGGRPIGTNAEYKNTFERMVSIIRVLLEHKHAEAAIRTSNERYALATKATNDAIWDSDLEAGTVYWSEGFFNLFGYPSQLMNSSEKTWENAVHPEDYERVVQGFQKFISDKSNRETLWEIEYRFCKADGSYALVLDRAFQIFDANGKLVRLVGSIQDVTEKREMEHKLIQEKITYQRNLATSVLSAQEKEREEIGRELHDNVNQILSTSKLYLEVSGQDADTREKYVSMGIKHINDAINEIRVISRTLVPVAISDLGLIDSIQDLVNSISKLRSMKIEFKYNSRIDKILSNSQKTMVFRIIQEQINNVNKHANATFLTINIKLDGSRICLCIDDNGLGFDITTKTSKKGLGLFNIQSRTELLNGRMELLTSPGNGCKLKVQIPVENI